MQDQGPKYWELDEVTKMVWDTTRGIKRGTDVEAEWGAELHEAVDLGVITPAEYVGILRKWTLMKNSSGGTRKNRDRNS